MTTESADGSAVARERVRARYAAAADQVRAGRTPSCSGSDPAGMCGDAYDPSDLADAAGAGVASLGCGNPLAVAELLAGETVLDLGSGAGLDVLLSARRVGPTGFAYGLDMTDEMLDLARQNAADAGVTNVEFLRGHIEAIPLPDASVDVVISNCVINLSTDAPAVFGEIARVLRPGGRLGVSDLVADDEADRATVADGAASVGAITGVLRRAEYRAQLREAGLSEVAITLTQEVAGGVFSAVIQASRT
ncbi:methyltransferase domain-containing protein [Actinomycetospora straminea]|uniref:Arsenite methyltransferase n=1 Tax=Actinomycetospora straminea TaxID=663607 RepID=A0ABP9DXT6_9PSEU|nr:methyltransferase domain-containing protein [Actinomycetospora straminea]MDD7934197.1 methyltransferase domain-containing protein [Actinomycetospora straminea]